MLARVKTLASVFLILAGASNSQYEVTVQPGCWLVVSGGINPCHSSGKPVKTDLLGSPKVFFVRKQGF